MIALSVQLPYLGESDHLGADSDTARVETLDRVLVACKYEHIKTCGYYGRRRGNDNNLNIYLTLSVLSEDGALVHSHSVKVHGARRRGTNSQFVLE